jgi:uncharacterized membrane protein YjjP (DUF1212 family)
MFRHRRSRYIEYDAGTTSHESASLKSNEEEEFIDYNETMNTFGKVSLNNHINRKLTHGLYDRKGYLSDLEK